MEVVLLLVLLVVIGGDGYYFAHRPTVTPEIVYGRHDERR